MLLWGAYQLRLKSKCAFSCDELAVCIVERSCYGIPKNCLLMNAVCFMDDARTDSDNTASLSII